MIFAVFGSRLIQEAQLPQTDSILGKFQMAITLQRVILSRSCLVLWWDFQDDGSNGAIPVGSNTR